MQLTTTDNGGMTPPNGSTLSAGQTFTLSANAADDTRVESVAFLIDGSVVGRTSTAPHQLQVSLLAPGDHTLMARATDNQGASTDSNTIIITIRPPSGTTFAFIGGAGAAWSDASNWSPQGVPGAGDLAQLQNGQAVSIAGATITVGSLTVAGGSAVVGDGTLTVNKSLNFNGGTLSNLLLIIPSGGQFTLTGQDEKAFSGVTIDNSGTTKCIGTGAITGDADTVFNNNGIFTVQSASSGTATTATFGQFTNAAFVQIKGSLVANAYTQSAGQLDLNAYLEDGQPGPLGMAVIQASTVTLNGGTLTGSGTIIGNLINNGGSIVPGHSAGSFSVQGDYTQGPNAVLALEIGGTQPGQFDQLLVSGTAKLAGTLSVRTIDGFTPNPEASFAPLQFSAVSGDFATTSSNAEVAVSSSGVAVKVTGPNPPPPALLNIATRLRAEAGENALIGGFIITGSVPKKVLIRALGRSLLDRGIQGALQDPTLELHTPDGTTFNNNWKDSQEDEINATTIPPADDREAAIVATLEPGVAYTAVVRGDNDSTGVGLVEVYDLDQAAPSTLANISTRGFVQTGENVMIGGLIIGGNEPAKVLIRAIGPSLVNRGVAGALQDPELDLVDKDGNIISNDDWRSTQESEIVASTVPPSDNREAAIMATLVPGAYTAIVRGKGEGTGVALVEAYNLK